MFIIFILALTFIVLLFFVFKTPATTVNFLIHGCIQIRILFKSVLTKISCRNALFAPAIAPFAIVNPTEADLKVVKLVTGVIRDLINQGVLWDTIRTRCLTDFGWIISYNDISMVKRLMIQAGRYAPPIDPNVVMSPEMVEQLEYMRSLLKPPTPKDVPDLPKINSLANMPNTSHEVAQSWSEWASTHMGTIILVGGVVIVTASVAYYLWKKKRKGGDGDEGDVESGSSASCCSSTVNKIVNNYLVPIQLGIYIILILKINLLDLVSTNILYYIIQPFTTYIL